MDKYKTIKVIGDGTYGSVIKAMNNRGGPSSIECILSRININQSLDSLVVDRFASGARLKQIRPNTQHGLLFVYIRSGGRRIVLIPIGDRGIFAFGSSSVTREFSSILLGHGHSFVEELVVLNGSFD